MLTELTFKSMLGRKGSKILENRYFDDLLCDFLQFYTIDILCETAHLIPIIHCNFQTRTKQKTDGLR